MQIESGISNNQFSPPRLGQGERFSPDKNYGSPQDTFVANPDTADKALSQPSSQGQLGTLLYGNVSLDLYFSRSESLTREQTSKGPDGYTQIRQELSRKFESSLSLDFSFLAKLDGAAERLNKLDPAVYNDFMNTTARLLDLKEGDFKDFVNATDELFNEIEKTLGMGPQGLDYVADFFTGQVQSFIGDVKTQLDYYDSNPLGEGTDQSLGIPAMMENIKDTIPNDLKKYLEELMASFEKNMLDSIDSKSALLKSIEQLYNEIIAKYNKDDNEEAPQEVDYANNDKKQEPPQEVTTSQNYQQYFERSFTAQIIVGYQAMSEAPLDNNAPQKQLDVLA